ncbi:Protein kinase-like domain [Penicillium digitatum]|uniref:Protein kinase-like domain n=1 Tax=Penicillium digitatum TaxID=36651 RepID=A0A7T6XE82_PENDI|nr:Protein kinase-like domain [Penicillium digitatum]
MIDLTKNFACKKNWNQARARTQMNLGAEMTLRPECMHLLWINHGYWPVGIKIPRKECRKTAPCRKVINIHFTKGKTVVPVPKTVQEWTQGETHFQVVERVPRTPLEEIWPIHPLT